MPPAHSPATWSWVGASAISIQLWTVREALCPKWGWGVRRLGGVFAEWLRLNHEISAVWTRRQELRSSRESDWGGAEDFNTEEWGGIVWPVKFSDVLSGGGGEDGGIPGKDNTCLQAQGHSSIRFSLWRGRETRRWQDLHPGRGIRVPQVGAQNGQLPGAARVCWRSWVDSRPWSQSLLGLKPRSVTYCR